MADSRRTMVASGDFREAVCIDGGRVYDSCCARDCLEDLRVYFSPENQAIVDTATNIRCRGAEVSNVFIDLESVNLNRGFYSCDITFYFLVNFSVTAAGATVPTDVEGIATFNKRVILYGSEGNVRTFSNLATEAGGCNPSELNTLPRCVVQTVDPVTLGCRFVEYTGTGDVALIPQCVLDLIGGEIGTPAADGMIALVTLGLFSVVQLIRNVQMLIPVYDFCIPEQKCSAVTDNPCEIFSRLDFPTNDFFPPRQGECDSDSGQTEC